MLPVFLRWGDLLDAKRIAESLDRLEKLRKSVRNSVVFFIVIISLSFLSIFAESEIYQIYQFYIGGLALIGIIFGSTINKKKRVYKKLYNEVIVRTVFERYFDIREFNSDYGIPYSAIKNTRMMKMGNTYSSNDFLCGEYKNIAFSQSDVTISEEHYTGRQKTSITYFKGRWMIFDFNKNFDCDLLVHDKSFNYADHRKNLFSKEFEKIRFENIEFNKAFESYTNNEQEAFYIITPHIMDSMTELREKTNGALIFCFCRNQLHIGVNNRRDAFEPPIFRPIDVESAISDISYDVSIITRFVDELNLDRKVYKK